MLEAVMVKVLMVIVVKGVSGAHDGEDDDSAYDWLSGGNGVDTSVECGEDSSACKLSLLVVVERML